MEPEDKPESGAGIPPPENRQYITEDQLEKTLSARMRAIEQRVEKTLSSAFESFGAKLKLDLASLIPAPKPEPKPEPKKEPAPPDPELKKLQEQVGTLTKQAEQARGERDAERAKVRDATLRQRVGELLATAGVEGVRARHAIGLLVDAEERIRWTEEGDAIVFRTADRDDVELETGLRAWLKTDDAKLYLPPKGSQGSGDRPGAGPPTAGTNGPLDRRTVADGLRRALLGQM